MKLETTRFGSVSVETDDILTFVGGILGLEDCHHWVLLADVRNSALGWLQSINRPEVALAVVSPRRFVSDYQLRVMREELEPLRLGKIEDAHVLVIASKNEQAITLNLKAPLVINLDRRLGRQVVHSGNQPLQYELEPARSTLKMSA